MGRKGRQARWFLLCAPTISITIGLDIVIGCSSQDLIAVKPALTTKRPKRHTENDEYAAFTRRVLRAYGRRIAGGDIDAIADLDGLLSEIEAALSRAVTGLRDNGYSLADIGLRLGVTRQAVHQRWADAQP